MMRRFVSVICCLLVTFPMTGVPTGAQQNSAPAAPNQAPLVACKGPCLEDGTPVKLRIAQTVSSADAHVNDRVEFEVLEEIRIQGVLIVPKGGIALGTVTEAQPKRRMARGGKLEIVMDSVRLEDGEKAALRATKGGNGGGHTGAMTAGIVATALVCIVCAPLFLLMHGKDITIPKGTEIPTFVNGNMPLDLAKFQQGTAATQQAQANPPASDALPNSVGQTSNNAQLEVTSTPSGADVELDGSFVGNTPSSIGVSPGEHTVSVKKSGFKPWERKIKISSGKVNISAELEAEVKQLAPVAATATPASEVSKQQTEGAAPEHTAAPVAAANEAVSAGVPEKLGTVFFRSDPTGADVYVDDVDAGKSPITLHLKTGHHYVRTFEDGYKDWSQLVTITPGAEIKLTATLDKSN
jgi:PEGA domain